MAKILAGAKIEGLDDFKAAEIKFGGRKLRSLLQRALNQSVQPVVKTARQNSVRMVGRNTGKGQKNIKKRNLKKNERNKLGIDQGVTVYLHSDGYYLGFWEHGFTRNGIQYPARPWMRPAFDSQQGAVLQRYKTRAGELIKKELAKK